MMPAEPQIELRPGIDRTFYDLLDSLYAPMLSARHLRSDRFQFTIYCKPYSFPVGIISVNKGSNRFLQVAVIPEARGTGIAPTAVTQVLRIASLDKVDWACKRLNYPSLRLLDSLEGGLLPGSLKPGRHTYEGFARIGGTVGKTMRRALRDALPESHALFRQWHDEVYAIRSADRYELKRYLFGYLHAIDSHLHVHSSEIPFATKKTTGFASKFCRPITAYRLRDLLGNSRVHQAIVFGCPSDELDLEEVNRFILRFAAEADGVVIPFGILHDGIDLDNAIAAGFMGFKEHVYGMRIQRDHRGRDALARPTRKRLYRVLAARGVPLLSHMGDNVVERVLDILRGAPRLKLILAHLGASFTNKPTQLNTVPILKALAPHPNVCFDVSAIQDPALVEEALRTVGADRILWGSDWPCETPEASIERILRLDGLSMFDCHSVFGAAALRVLHRDGCAQEGSP